MPELTEQGHLSKAEDRRMIQVRTRVKIVKTPSQHASGKDSGPCTCKGQTGTVSLIERVGHDTLVMISLDKKGQVGVPLGDIVALKSSAQ